MLKDHTYKQDEAPELTKQIADRVKETQTFGAAALQVHGPGRGRRAAGRGRAHGLSHVLG